MTFLLLLMILDNYGKKKDLTIILIFLLTILIGIGWEIFENSDFIVNSGLKANNRQDSFVNSTTDIIFHIIGASTILIIFRYIDKNKVNKKKRY